MVPVLGMVSPRWGLEILQQPGTLYFLVFQALRILDGQWQGVIGVCLEANHPLEYRSADSALANTSIDPTTRELLSSWQKYSPIFQGKLYLSDDSTPVSSHPLTSLRLG